jgi:RIO-like serine/threonine protein kinase
MNFARTKQNQLGDDGKEGRTYQAVLGGQSVAVKTFKSTKSTTKIEREAHFQQLCAHAGVAPVVHTVNTDEKFIVMCKLHSLPAVMYKKSSMPDDLQYMICALMGRMDKVGVLHGDMNALNVMCDKHDRPYMIDFGFAKKISSKMSKKYKGHPNVKVSLWGLIRGFKRYKVGVNLLADCVAAEDPGEYFERGEELLKKFETCPTSKKSKKRKR